ncbi:MAG TPA: DUF2188 domain-containing protein [Chondromyces sp.]|nr:DUF2188 domain-containing protein [Chondromyces sp.]
MPWTQEDYPASMKNLPEEVRNKAIEIANAILEEGEDEGSAIAIGIEKAREYVGNKEGEQTIFHLSPKEDGWELKKEDGDQSIMTDVTKEGLEERAKEYVRKQQGILVIHRMDGSEQDRLYES